MKQVEIEGSCEYSRTWVQKCKKRHVIQFWKTCGGQAFAEYKAVGKFIDYFSKVIAEETLMPEQVYTLVLALQKDTGYSWWDRSYRN
jgi:hypothetical protein